MASGDDVQLLVDFGLINEDGVSRLANLIRGVQSLAGGGGGFSATAGRTQGRRRGRPPRTQGGGAEAPAARKARRGKRTPFDASKEDLQKARETMTVAQIAAKYGVSRPTVFLRLKKFGLTTPRKGAKKK